MDCYSKLSDIFGHPFSARSIGFVGISAIVVGATLAHFLPRKFWYKELEGIHGPKQLPVVGNLLDVCYGPQSLYVMERWMNEFPDVAKGYLGFVPIALLLDGEAAKALLSSNKNITKGRLYYTLSFWLGEGLLLSTGALWKSRRRLLTPAFHFDILEEFLSVMAANSEVLVENLDRVADSRLPCDMFPLVTACTLDIICETALGVSVHAQRPHLGTDPGRQYVQAVHDASTFTWKWMLQPYLWNKLYWLLPRARAHKRTLDTLHAFTESVIRDRRRELEGDGGRGSRKGGQKKSFLDILILSRDIETGAKLRDKEVREEVDTFAFEGHDTTAAAMGFCLQLLGTHIDVQERVQEEVDAFFDKFDLENSRTNASGNSQGGYMLEMKHLKDLPFLEAVIKETLRLYPSVPWFSRKLAEPLQVHGKTIPVGVEAVVPPYCIHR